MEQSATRDSGLLLTFDIPEGDQVSPSSSVIRLTCAVYSDGQQTSALSCATVFSARDIDIANLSVCLSVRYVPVPYENGLTYRHSFFNHTVAQSFCFYLHQTSSRNSDGVTPCGGAKYRWGIRNSRFSTNKSLYLANDARYRHSYYRRRIGNRTQAFEWH